MNTATDFLARVVAAKREQMALIPAAEREHLADQARSLPRRNATSTFRNRIARKNEVNIIAEIKRRSPSAGDINPAIDAVQIARVYASAGAAAISVLTEPEHFGGSLKDLCTVAAAVELPVLRKDFIVDAHQVNEAAIAGASAVLLIAAALDAHALRMLRALTEDTLGMDALVEVHSEDEMRKAQDSGATLIGVNNRNLATLEVDLATSRALAAHANGDCILVSESGLRSTAELRELRALGFSAFLIGEHLMRTDEPGAALEQLLREAAHG
jgi:indole-3-glycerol phosphate synthase